MPTLSFRVDSAEAEETARWAKRLGIDRSELLRDALHRHLIHLRAGNDGEEAWLGNPLMAEGSSLAKISDWGPAEDWTDWLDATG